MKIELFKEFLNKNILVMKKSDGRTIFFKGLLKAIDEEDSAITIFHEHYGTTILNTVDILEIKENKGGWKQ